MINLSRVLSNPHFRQTFNVYRSEGHFGRGGWIEDTPSPAYFAVSGIVYPSSAKEIQQVPEGDRIEGMMTFLSKEALYTTRKNATQEGTSDQIEWGGDKYKIVQILPFSDYGFYVAVGARMIGK